MLHAYSTFALCKKKLCRSLLPIVLGFSVTACTTVSIQSMGTDSQKITPDWLAQKAILEKMKEFDTRGRVAFKNSSQSLSANFYWQQRKDSLSLRLTNFLGSTMLKLDSSPAGTTIIDHRGNRHHGQNMSVLIESLTGINLPIAELANWLKALPNENNGFQLNKINTLASLSQYPLPKQHLGWEISYPNYRRYQNVNLPQRIDMKNKDQQVNLSISSWIIRGSNI